MPTLTGLTTNFFATPNEGFTTTTSGPVDSSSDTVVPFNSVSGLTNGSIFTGLIDPGNAKERAFTGVVDTGGSQITSVKFTTGSNATHTTGATIVDYVTGTHFGAMTKGIGITHEQSGLNKSGVLYPSPVFSGTATGTYTLGGTPTIQSPTFTGAYSGWVTETELPDTITNNGNRSYDLVFNSTDLTDTVSAGMRLRLTRTVSAPTYMGGLFNGSSHYFTKTTCTSTLSTVTNNFTMKATVEPTSYANAWICGRSDATPNNGFGMFMNGSGQLTVYVYNGGNANYRYITSYQSLPLNKKTKVWISWTSGTVVMKFDGATVPTSAAVTGGTAPTTAGTGGDWSIGRLGAYNGQYFPGYINDVGVFDAVITPTTMLSLDGQALLGSETNCIGAWSLNNTGVNQQAAGTNDLTATGGVSYTVRSPYGNYLGGTLEYAIITKTAFSTNTTLTVQVPEGCAIPTSGGVSAVAYSTQKAPYGFPTSPNRWRQTSLHKTSDATTSNATYGAFVAGGWSLTVPIGEWVVGWQADMINVTATVIYFNISSTALTGLTATQGANTSPFGARAVSTTTASITSKAFVQQPQSLSTAQAYVMYTLGATTAAGIGGDVTLCEMFAEFGLL